MPGDAIPYFDAAHCTGLSYNERMKYFVPLAALLLAGTAVNAAPMDDDRPVMAPPGEIHEAPQAGEAPPQVEETLNLREELRGPKTGEGVEVRSYKRKDGVTIREYSMKGRVYMVRVDPGGGLPAYYLYDTNGDGVFDRRLPGQYKRISPPMWVIQRF